MKKKILGFIIANELEEFLVSYKDTEESTSVLWSRIPDLAKVFSDPEEAGRLSSTIYSPYKRWVCRLSDIGSQLIVEVSGDDVPPWI